MRGPAPGGSGERALVLGRKPVLEALAGSRHVRRIHLLDPDSKDANVRAIVAAAEAAGVPVLRATAGALDRLARGTSHQGAAAECEPLEYVSLDDILKLAERRGEPAFIILLDHVEDPHNLGAVLRVADGAGAHGVVIPERGAAGLGPAAIKASAGAAEHVPVARVSTTMDAVNRLKRAGVWICGTAADEGKTYFDERLTGPLALAMGSEGEGLSGPVRKHVDFFVRIPMKGGVSSLNVSVATAIIAYERLRQSTQPKA
ncbi:MAG TPA: 23S rRNA (guanosine(2251)-2'-O)-methyltransferase RlmB [Candidatus Thermoplasmatota archaeon]|nr:23S rRNA (guanosine(2251)-2'-O)-methyltransferase RlmB [Candidatus Thermoplasmatota archaeon]